MIHRLILLAMVASVATLATAIDHNNIDAGRPLRFDDAYSIAFGERALEFGFNVDAWRRQSPVYGLKAELKYGFSKNQDFSIAFEPTYATNDSRFDANNVELSYFHGLKREIGNSPAIGYRVDIGLPTERDAEGVDLRFRGVITKTVKQYDKLHLNLDATYLTRPNAETRRVAFGATLGYSSPVGYPTRFHETLVAEFGVRQSPIKGQGWTGSAGLGLRKQIGVQSVVDIGLQADVFSSKAAPKTDLRIVIGYSVSF